MTNLPEITSQVRTLSAKAAAFIAKEAKNFSTSAVELKGKSDLVSYVDKQTEELLVAGLKEILPEAGFITEEDTPNQTDRDYIWIIDPLDGTTNFVHGLPTYAVSVALMHKDQVILGVVHEVCRNESFYAWKGGGAYVNDQPIHVTPVTKIEDSLFATGFPYYQFHKLEEYLAILNELMKNCHGLRRIGSAAVDMAYVACGRCEGFFEYNLNAYDIAAGVIIVQEAGGTITDFKGGDDFLFGRELVAAGPVHHEFLKVIQKYW
ncbi:MAG: inositol monophosphatase family protein [Cyclobacteriaceae bacterium]